MTNFKTIQNAANIPLNAKQGTVPNMRGALNGYLQTMTFGIVTKKLSGGVTVETMETVVFEGTPLTPHKPRALEIAAQGERSWSWYEFLADPQLVLNTDDVVTYLGEQFRVFSRDNYRTFNFYQYVLIQDWKNAGPTVVP